MRFAKNQFSINFGGEITTVNPAHKTRAERRREQRKKRQLTCGDFLAGGGGMTRAMHELVEGTTVKWVLNHDIKALRTNLKHHEGVKHYWADIHVQDEHEMEYVDIVFAAFECQQHGGRNGTKKKKLGSYMMPWELVRYAKHLQPLVIGVENVPGIKNWAPVDENNIPIEERKGEEFEKWKQAVMDLGYNYTESIRVAADDGLPTIRKRYFAFFYREGIEINWPDATHSKGGKDGKLKWESCGQHIDLDNHGESIFGRQFNENIKPQFRKPLVTNSIERIIGGIQKNPELHNLLVQYYGANQKYFQSQSLEDPIYTLRTKDCHQVVQIKHKELLEKMQFIADYYRVNTYQSTKSPLKTQVTWQTKTLVSFLAHQYNSNGNPGANIQSLDDPIRALVTEEKIQFIVAYYNASGRPDTQNYSLNEPMRTLTTSSDKQALVTFQEFLDDFDIRVRFITKEEAAACTTFPRDYFEGVPTKDAFRQIGNAVPPDWGKVILTPNIKSIMKYKYGNAA